MNAAPMVNTCLRHQMPEAYGLPSVGDVTIPQELRYGADEPIPITPMLPEVAMGAPDAVPLEYDGPGYA